MAAISMSNGENYESRNGSIFKMKNPTRLKTYQKVNA